MNRFDDMTLADLEALASRFAAAVKTISDAQKLLGRGVPTTEVVSPVSSSVGASPPPLTPSEMAQRQALIERNFPKEIVEATRG